MSPGPHPETPVGRPCQARPTPAPSPHSRPAAPAAARPSQSGARVSRRRGPISGRRLLETRTPEGKSNNKSLSRQTNVKCLCRLFLFLILLLQEWRVCCFFHVSFQAILIIHLCYIRDSGTQGFSLLRLQLKCSNLLAIQIYSCTVNIADMLKNFKQLQRSLTPPTVPQSTDDEKTSAVFPWPPLPPPPFS